MTTLEAPRVIEQCGHGRQHDECPRCGADTLTSYNKDRCHCTTCKAKRRAHRASRPPVDKQRRMDEGTPTPGLRFDITCPDCAGELRFVTSGVPSEREATAVMRCAGCNREHIVKVFILGRNGRIVK